MANLPRTILALALLAGVYVSVLLVASIDLAFVVVPILADLLWHENFTLASLSALLASVTAPGLLALWYGLLVLRRVGEPWKSIQLPAQGVDPLREMITEVADTAHTDPPQDLRLTAIPNAGVTERSRLLSLRGGSRTLYLGLPLLAGLSVTELRAVLSHERGHYAGGHSRPGRLAHRGLVALVGLRAVMRLLLTSQPRRGFRVVRPLAVLIWLFLCAYAAVGYGLFTGYETVYRRLSFAMRRSQEFEADASAERVVGGEELAKALRRIHVLGAAWGDFQSRFLVPMQRAGCTPDDPFEEFGRMLADDAYQETLAAFEHEQGKRLTSLDATHPCLPDRLARMSAGTEGTVGVAWPVDRRNATALLPKLLDEPWSAQLAATLRPPGGRQEALLWDDCLNRMGQVQAAAQADRLVRTALGTDRPTPAGVLRSVAVRRGELTAAVASRAGSADSANAPGADSLGLLAGRLFAFIAFTMVSGGQARWLASWRDDPGTGGLVLASWDGTDFATEQVAARVGSFAVDPTEANESWLLDHLRSLGIDPGEPVDLTIGHEAPSAGAGTATAPGDTVVIRTMSEPEEVRNERTLTRIVSSALALTAVAVGVGVSVHDAPPPYQPPPVSWSPQSIPSYPYPALTEPTLAMPSLPDVLPTSILDQALWPKPALGGIAGCPPPLPAEECTKIVVAQGDTLSQLACAYRTTVAALQQMNHLSGSTEIYAGETLTVPYQQDGPARCG
jgi:Zn-dependent protease with chaperone function